MVRLRRWGGGFLSGELESKIGNDGRIGFYQFWLAHFHFLDWIPLIRWWLPIGGVFENWFKNRFIRRVELKKMFLLTWKLNYILLLSSGLLMRIYLLECILLKRHTFLSLLYLLQPILQLCLPTFNTVHDILKMIILCTFLWFFIASLKFFLPHSLFYWRHLLLLLSLVGHMKRILEIGHGLSLWNKRFDILFIRRIQERYTVFDKLLLC